MTNELTDVRCPCGTEFPAESYDAGFIAGSGMCQNCDAALPPKDICTCPSGDGSLRHPCPAHPGVEQAGGDERDLQGTQGERDGWGPFPIVQVPWNVFDRAVMWVEDRRRYGDDGTIVDDWKALKTIQRAALAQPSTASDLDPLNLAPHAEAFNEAPDEALRPEQAEAERPEVVARVMHSNPVALDQCAPLNANDELMTVAQHAASVARWAEMFNRVEQERDAALAELEKQEPAATVAKVPGEDWNSLDFHLDLQGMLPGTKLYAAPPAKAQHSVPDVCDGKEQDAFEEWAKKEGLDTSCHPMHWLFLDAKTNSARQGWKAALRYVRAQAAAPGKEGV
ncbi:hypothetical protein [Pseudomonas aeruginosa]|uniref:hypothetical protein n=1 Tax=Pseudomonas aeruginosa TaxID=287 RepID=UPI00211814D4|nr:hypothetical protein [Pseudomonas aeruginosa]